MSTIKKALVADLRLTSMNLLAYGAMDSSVAKNQHELMNMLSNIETLESFEIKYDRLYAELKIKVKGKIAIYLPKKKKSKKVKSKHD